MSSKPFKTPKSAESTEKKSTDPPPNAITLIATTAMGLESELKYEIQKQGFAITKVSDGKVEFQAAIPDICTANLWLRTAGRVYLKIGQFNATTFDALFEHTKALDWANWIGPNDAFPVTKVMSRKSALFSRSDAQAIVKKAIVESLKKNHRRTTLPESSDATYAIRLHIESDEVTLSIDTSGDGLSKRGYRAHMGVAPIRETLAAGLLQLARWRPQEDVLLDPMCGTGTILIEAGLKAQNIAPGLNRSFASESWKSIPITHWQQARRDAKDVITPNTAAGIFGSDQNPRALAIARHNIQLAGLEKIFVQTLPMQDVRSRFKTGKIIVNPPYGERLTEKPQAQYDRQYPPPAHQHHPNQTRHNQTHHNRHNHHTRHNQQGEQQPDRYHAAPPPDPNIDTLYHEMGITFQTHFSDWSHYILTAYPYFESAYGKKAVKKRKLYNGGLQCGYYSYY